MALSVDQLAVLAKTKLEALVRGSFPEVTAGAQTFSGGVAIRDGYRAFVYLMADKPSPLGAALAWGVRKEASELHVVVDSPDPVLTVMAAGLDPKPILWEVAGRNLVPMTETKMASAIEPSETAMALAGLLSSAGCEIVVENGAVIGEIQGLEVARVVIAADGQAHVRVGVGLYDQDAGALAQAGRPVEDRLADVIAEVRSYRNNTALPHPLNRVARSRWLRSVVSDQPELVGLDAVAKVAPLFISESVRDDRPVAALGVSNRGEDVLVVCSSGVDLDLIPVTAAHSKMLSTERAVLVLPSADHYPILRQVARHLALPADFVALPTPWWS